MILFCFEGSNISEIFSFFMPFILVTISVCHQITWQKQVMEKRFSLSHGCRRISAFAFENAGQRHPRFIHPWHHELVAEVHGGRSVYQ